jgi:hypothetical protein
MPDMTKVIDEDRERKPVASSTMPFPSEWNVHLAMIAMPTHCTFAGAVRIDRGLYYNSCLACFVSRVPLFHLSGWTTACILAERGSKASPGSFNRARVRAFLTFSDASSGLQPSMSTDTLALRKERLKYAMSRFYFAKVEALLTIRQIH